MSVVSKKYRTASGELRFDFHFASLLGSLDDFDVVDISPLRYGFDSDDAKAIAAYPGNIEITIDDQTGDNYSNFKKFYSHYSSSYPFNHYDVLQLVVSINNEVIFRGVIDELSNEYADRTVTVSFVDGINRYKDVRIVYPAVLDKLFQMDIVPREVLYDPVQGNLAYAYGFGSIRYLTFSSVGWSVTTPGYFPGNIESGDRDVRLDAVIRQMILTLRPDLLVEYQNDLKYGDFNTATADMVGIEQLNVRRIMSTLFGRYLVIVKTPGRENQIADVEGSAEYQKPETFELVYDDETHMVYHHKWEGTYPQTISGKKWHKGLDDVRISEILKTLATNTYSYFGLKGVNTFFFRHKRFSSSPVVLSGIRSMSKWLVIDKVDEVLIKDYFTDNFAKKGNDYGSDDGKLEYKIPLNAFRTGLGWEYRLNYFSGGEQRVTHFYDPVLNIRDIPQEYISLAEWQAHQNFISRYEFELQGIDFNMDGTFRIEQDNYNDYLRPLTIEKYLLEDYTKMTGLQI